MEIANVEQSAAWNGKDGEHWTRFADRYDASTCRHWEPVLATGLFTRDSRILDIGCGSGQSSRELACVASNGSVLGLDLSAAMLDLGRRRAAAAGVTNVTFVQGDAQVHPFPIEAHDAAVSFFGGMFFGDPVAAYQNIAKGLTPGSPLVLVGWRDISRNEWFANFRVALAAGRDLPVPPPHAPSPFFFADSDHLRDVLETAGFEGITFKSVDVPMEFGGDVDEAWEFVSSLGLVEWLTRDLEGETRQRALDALRADLVAHDTGHGVSYSSSSWLITARRA